MKLCRLVLSALCMFTIVFSCLAQSYNISGGADFSAAVCDNQVTYVWGSNQSNQLGIDNVDVPIDGNRRNFALWVTRGNISASGNQIQYGPLPPMIKVDAGKGSHLLVLSCENQIWTWGENASGQLGRGNSSTHRAVPQRVFRGEQQAMVSSSDPNGIFLNDIAQISGGLNASYAIEKSSGRILAWGDNSTGQLGNGNFVSSNIPVYVLKSNEEGGGYLTGIYQVGGGEDCVYALDSNGNVWSWGSNDGNRLGRPGNGNLNTAGRVQKGAPDQSCYGGDPMGNLSDIIMIAAGNTHALALDKNGNVWSFGGDWGEGQLGRGGASVYRDLALKVVNVGVNSCIEGEGTFLGDGTDGKATFVAASQASSAVVMANGRVVTFGARGMINSSNIEVNEGTINCSISGGIIPSGTLGDNSQTTTSCNSTNCVDLGSENYFSRTPVYVRHSAGHVITNIVEIYSGASWFFALRNQSYNEPIVWGWNRRGELGLGDYDDRCAATTFLEPSGCDFALPCPGMPAIGSDKAQCSGFSEVLTPTIQNISTYQYEWRFSEDGEVWTTISSDNSELTYVASEMGYYQFIVSDERPYFSYECSYCPVKVSQIRFLPKEEGECDTIEDPIDEDDPFICPASEEVIQKYKNDADRLAVIHLRQNEHLYKDSIIIHSPLSDTLLNALLAVYNLNTPERDTVVEIYSIHTFPNPVLNKVEFSADSSLAWMKELREGNFPSGNERLDSLMLAHNLVVDSYYNWSNLLRYHSVTLRSEDNLNMPAMVDVLSGISGIHEANQANWEGDGSRIEATVSEDNLELIFSYGWGDCPSGCTSRKFWKFLVPYDCNATFTESYGDVLSHTRKGLEKQLSIHPNPFSEGINVTGISENFHFNITDLSGKHVASGPSDKNYLPLGNLHPGFYLLTITHDNTSYTLKILKY
ncbi:MAG: T9SS type A sorting domain-containing protein [Cytophagaceae bacterium]